MNILDIIWKLPAAFVYQLYFVAIQQRGAILIDTRGELDLLTRLRRCQKPM